MGLFNWSKSEPKPEPQPEQLTILGQQIVDLLQNDAGGWEMLTHDRMQHRKSGVLLYFLASSWAFYRASSAGEDIGYLLTPKDRKTICRESKALVEGLGGAANAKQQVVVDAIHTRLGTKPKFDFGPTAKALAQAVQSGDRTAFLALLDWARENEDAIRSGQ